MLLRWLCLALWALGIIVGRSQPFYLEASAAAARASRHGRRRRRSPLPEAPLPVLPGGDPRLHMLSGCIALTIQTLAFVRWTDVGARLRTATGLVNMASAVIFMSGAMVLLPGLLPTFYRRHSRVILALTRLSYFSLPLLRDPQDVTVVFKLAPSSRVFGLVFDVWTLTLGARGLALLLGPLVSPLPLLPHMLLSAFSVQRVRTTSTMCALPFLRHAIWQRRISRVLQGLGALPLLGPDGHTLTSLADPATPEGSETACRVVVSFYQLLLGMVAPTLLLAKLHAPLRTAMAAAAALDAGQARGRQGVSSGGSRGSLQQQRRRSPQKGAGRRLWQWACGAAERGEAAVMCASQLLLNGCGSPLLTLAAWWALLSVTWALALTLELPQFALQMPDTAEAAL